MQTRTTVVAILALVVTTAAIAVSIGIFSTIPSALAQGNATAGGNMTGGGGNMTSSGNATK